MDEEDQRWMAGGGVGVKSGRHSSAQLQPFELSGELLILLLFSLFAGYLWHPHNIITNIIIWSVIIRVLKARYLILCLFKGFYFWDEERERKWKMWWHEGRIMRMRDGMEWMMIYCKSVRDFDEGSSFYYCGSFPDDLLLMTWCEYL